MPDEFEDRLYEFLQDPENELLYLELVEIEKRKLGYWTRDDRMTEQLAEEAVNSYMLKVWDKNEGVFCL